MASQVDSAIESHTSPKLPVLREGQSSLVCKDKLPSPPTPREQASEWAVNTRKRCVILLDSLSKFIFDISLSEFIFNKHEYFDNAS